MRIMQRTILSELYSEINGSSINANAKSISQNQKYASKTLYGETPFATICKILLNPLIAEYVKNAKVFYDLGSGIGNVVIGASLLGLFDECNGVELFEISHQTAQSRKEMLAKIQPQISAKINFFCDSITSFNISNADIVFTNHPITLEDTDLLQEYDANLSTLKSGAIVCYVIRTIDDNSNFTYLGSETMKFSWGNATVHFYKRK